MKLVVGKKSVSGQIAQITGIEEISITRSCEEAPNHCRIHAFDHVTGQADIVFSAGDAIQIAANDKIVFTGYVDAVTSDISSDSVRWEILSRGLLLDICDSSNQFAPNQIAGSSVVDVANQLVEPFGITVVNQISGTAPAIPSNPINKIAKVFELINYYAAYSGCLAYESPLGELVIATVPANGTARMTSGFTQGVNVQQFSVTNDWTQRYGTYIAVNQPFDAFQNTGNAINVSITAATATDQEIVNAGRKRYLVFISNQYEANRDIIQLRANWEASRRAGRSKSVTVTVDSWFDTSGNLWAPNSLVSINLPRANLPKVEWIIAHVSFALNPSTGTTASVTCYPAAAFSLEPFPLVPVGADIARAEAGFGNSQPVRDGRRDQG